MTKDISLPNTGSAKARHRFDTIHRRDRTKNARYNKCFQNYYHSYQYLQPNPCYIPSIKSSVNHWQLRDLLKYDPQSNTIYYTKNDTIQHLDLASYTSGTHLKLNYYPRCYNHTNNGVVVTGGLLTSSSKLFSMNLENLSMNSNIGTPRRISKGLFSFYNPNLDVTKTVRLGEMINNDVTVYQSSTNSYNSYICNNDSNLYCVDINTNDSIRVVNKINCEINTCLNNVVKNPTTDKMLTVTGDSSSIFLIDPTSSSPNIRTIKSGHESGFGISYHSNGHLFSTVFQDGTCLLYDLRNISDSKPLIEIRSTRPGHQSGAFRVCKFSPENDMNDLLIISEHVGRVHLIDLRNLNYDNVDDHQVMVVPFALDQYGEYKSMMNDEAQSGMKNGILQSQRNRDNDDDTVTHNPIGIYSDSYFNSEHNRRNSVKNSSWSAFTSPLVFDYDYLTNLSPKLFKDFVYTPPPPPSPPQTPSKYLPPPEFTYPQWNNPQNDSTDCNNNPISPTTSQRPSVSQSYGDELQQSDFDDTNPDIDSQLNYVYRTMDTRGAANTISTTPQSSSSDTYTHYSNYCDDSYQQTINHIHGEMELSGIEFCTPRNSYDSNILIGCQDAGIVSWGVNGAARRGFGRYGFA
ncbi:uncharacterized protein RJT20DRAFT_122613 [Scheffersomyces xylosifermentans]|uniref:uncharacterized protein n=1 Tax=Scheffersomyces xylosifermentans TaxID=1304137 RepID=UPI00315D606F